MDCLLGEWLSNAYLGTTLLKDDPKIQAIREGGWGKFPLSYDQVKYAAMDARLGFEIVRWYRQLVGYNSHVDPLNVV